MIKIIDNTTGKKEKKYPKLPFFTRSSEGHLYLVYHTDNGKYDSIDMDMGEAVGAEFDTLEDMFADSLYKNDTIVEAEIIINDKKVLDE